MFSDKIQYNAPIPGEEFKARDLSVPSRPQKLCMRLTHNMGKTKNCVGQFVRQFFGGHHPDFA